MSEAYDEKLCIERHRRIEEKIDIHDRRLNAHSGQIDILMENKAENKAELSGLCKSIDNLNGRLDKIVVQNANMQKIFITALVGFFFFVLENKLFP